MPKLGDIIRAPGLSPTGLFVRGALLVGLLALCEAAGWREHTTFLSGTGASTATGLKVSAGFGTVYLFAYFGAVVVAPILGIAAILLTLHERLVPARPPSVPPSEKPPQ